MTFNDLVALSQLALSHPIVGSVGCFIFSTTNRMAAAQLAPFVFHRWESQDTYNKLMWGLTCLVARSQKEPRDLCTQKLAL